MYQVTVDLEFLTQGPLFSSAQAWTIDEWIANISSNYNCFFKLSFAELIRSSEANDRIISSKLSAHAPSAPKIIVPIFQCQSGVIDDPTLPHVLLLVLRFYDDSRAHE